MNKTLNINLGGYPFIINDDAYDLLSRYLGSIHRHFKASSSYDEITGDIESRLAEIFQEKLGARSIVEMRDIQAAIEIMGKPEDFGAEPIDNQSNTSYNSQSEYRTGKRLFRDPEDKVFGGICSGIAAYFGINDPLWVRILFVMLVFVFGVSAIFYFILWIAIPEALSSADRLAMRGEPINVSNIAKVVESEFNNLSDAINNAGNTNGEKKNNSFSTSNSYNRGKGSQGVADVFSFIGEMFRRLFDVLKLIFKPIFGLFGIIGIIVLACVWIAVMIGFAYGHPFINAMFGSSKLVAYIAGLNVFFLIAAVIGILIMLFLNVFFKIRVQPKWYGILGAFWFINGLSFAFTATELGKEFSEESTVKTEVFNVNLPSDTLNIQVIRDKKSSFRRFEGFGLKDGNLTYRGINLRVERSSTNEFRMVKEVRANGSSIEEAEQIASQINYQPVLEGNTLTCDEVIDVTGQKFRAQHVNLILYVPENKYIKLDKYANNHFVSFDFDWEDDCDNNDDEGEVWQMQSNGSMICPEGRKQNKAEKILSNVDFKTLKIRGNIDVEVRKADKYEVKLVGKDKYLTKVEVIQSENTLNIRSSIEDHEDNKMKIIILMPSLELFDAERVEDVEIRGFSQKEMKINLFGDFKADIIVDVENLTLDVEQARVDIQGKGDVLDARVEERAELRSRQFTVKTAKINLDDNSDADIYATERVEQKGDSNNLDVTGGAEVKNDRKKEENE